MNLIKKILCKKSGLELHVCNLRKEADKLQKKLDKLFKRMEENPDHKFVFMEKIFKVSTKLKEIEDEYEDIINHFDEVEMKLDVVERFEAEELEKINKGIVGESLKDEAISLNNDLIV